MDEPIHTGYRQLDRLLSDRPYGLRARSRVLVTGAPGVSKSTLLVVAAAAMSRHVPVLYATAEESKKSLATRARRLNVAETRDLHLLVCEDLVQLDKQVKRLRPTVLIIDSLQSMRVWRGVSRPDGVGDVSNTVSICRYASENAVAMNMAVMMTWHTTDHRAKNLHAMTPLFDVVLKLSAASPGSVLRRVEVVHGPATSKDKVALFRVRGDGLHASRRPPDGFVATSIVG